MHGKVDPIEMVNGGGAKKVPKSILQRRPKYNNVKPALVSPEKREEAAPQGEEALPIAYVETIQKGFGENADIFTDVLQVSKDAPSREVRIAYFRRGREVLAEGGFRTLDQAATVSDVSTLVRTRFQAVSMAYEIVSSPRWKSYYLQHGFKTPVFDDVASVDSADPVLGSSASLPGKYSKPAVRWNGQVEELLFEKEPDEHKKPAKEPKKKTKTKRVVVESGHLDEHLQRLDEEASKHFVTDFWDTLEESLDGLLRMGKPKEKSWQEDVEGSVAARGSFDSAESVEECDEEEACSVKSDDTPFDEDPIVEDGPSTWDPPAWDPHRADAPKSDAPEPRRIVKSVPLKPIPTKMETPSPFRPISPDGSNNGNTDGDAFEVESISLAGDLTHRASTPTNGRSADRPSPSVRKNERMPSEDRARKEGTRVVNAEPAGDLNDDDIFYGLEDDDVSQKTPVDAPGDIPDEGSRLDAPRHIAVLRVRSESPGTEAMSELTETVAFPKSLDDYPDDDDDDETAASEASSNANREADCGGKYAGKILESLGMGSRRVADDEDDGDSLDSSYTKKEDGFVTYLVAYISAIVHDCAGKISEVSEIDWDDTVLGAFMVDDRGMSKMLTTLESELQKAPSVDAVDVITSPPYEAIEAVRSFG
eukprot:CAMPEP_0117017712 /NCGR_PEP_ID=MMETSP0472-20121206/13798_1 /TAXON_ID=693140 ORGANISM="Tiarina fusus, Strain LIS" /NCGR_SAMPLE_ID=MMETSP0472 /ASSEMBLY_ACC=CAM_ASM_000603 /LENGTH=648 /DNA_ID=CAMNT_0004722167 /DNA_START=81 /DNA_END=2027 /DNA_ORIENTATION=+